MDIISSGQKSYPLRIALVWGKTLITNMKNYDMVFLGFEPQLVLHFIGFKFKKKPIMIDFFISVYDTMACDWKRFRLGSLLAKFCHYLDRKTIQRADYIISDTKAHASYFIEEFGADPDKMETLYLEADKSIYYPRVQKKPESLADKFVVLYFGSILPLQGTDVVLDAIRRLKDVPDIYFDIIGPIPKHKGQLFEYYSFRGLQTILVSIRSSDGHSILL